MCTTTSNFIYIEGDKVEVIETGGKDRVMDGRFGGDVMNYA
jgi:hypothetical protein